MVLFSLESDSNPQGYVKCNSFVSDLRIFCCTWGWAYLLFARHWQLGCLGMPWFQGDASKVALVASLAFIVHLHLDFVVLFSARKLYGTQASDVRIALFRLRDCV